MKTGLFLGVLMLSLTTLSFAHDGHHGPELKDSGKYGGFISPMVLAKDAPLGEKAKVIYKVELTHSQNGTLYLYLYDSKMTPLSLASFEKDGFILVEEKKNKKWQSRRISIEKKGNEFTGKLPKDVRRPFHLNVNIRANGNAFLASFNNVD